jgi:GT2 family glycosyltransferase
LKRVPEDRGNDRDVAEPEISVVVPTRGRPESLARCLTALDAQTARDSLEVIVVDDAEGGRDAAEGVTGEGPGRRLVRGEGRGAAAARNLGTTAARAPLVLFTDDDCEPRPDWAERLAAALRGETAAVAGSTVAASGGDPLALASQHVADYLTGFTLDRAGRTRFAPSSNLGCRAEVLARIPFDEGYPGSGGEDRDWCARLIESGHELVFVPDALVAHHQELTLGGFWRKHIGYGRGARMFHRRHGFPDTNGISGFHARLVWDAFRRGPAVGGLVCLAQVATAAGFVRQAVSDGQSGAG